ncbi:MAG TPA: DUF1501 domain-containing protein [Candidatus Margulisiibacteriota bacterium]|nr:DUF1501 domain-containing protein [Candidatus Margulisiibacteriota bacterium]
MKTELSRRNFLQLGASLGMLLGLSRFKWAEAAALPDYKALVCLFMFGGNDGHNTVVSLDSTQYNAYVAARGALALPQSQLLGIADRAQGAFGLHYAMPEMQTLYNQGQLAILANVGMLVQPTSFSQFSTPGYPVPLNLRSHADQVVQMQTGVPDASGSTGWGGRTLDLMEWTYSYNSTTSFPVSISMDSPALFCAGSIVRNVSLQPGNYLDQNAMSLWPASAAQARAAAQLQIASTTNGNAIVDAANKVMADALALNPLLKAAAGAVTFQKAFPATALGDQLKDIARMISLNAQLAVGRQVFFCSLSGFDTHGGQSYQQWSLLQQVSQALDAFYAATVQLGVANQVTAFTLSDFGRTLQPSGSGTDHGWGNHHLILGGAVKGGNVYGKFPLMTNYANFNASNDDYADTRGVMLPGVSLAQYGATLAKWFGAADADLDGLFPTISAFSTRDLGFMA